MWSSICVSQTISIWELNIYWFSKTRYVYLYVNHYNTTFHMYWWFDKQIKFNWKILDVIGWFHYYSCHKMVCQEFLRFLERGKFLNPTTLETEFFKSISLFTQLFTTFTFSFRRGISELTPKQYHKDKRLWLKIEKF